MTTARRTRPANDTEPGVSSRPDAGPGPASAGARRPGLAAAKERAILAAAFELLGEVGYSKLRIDAVARRARVGKATIYRHWAGKPELVMDAFAARARRDVPVPDTGTLSGDLRRLLGQLTYSLTRRDSGRIIAGLIAATQSDPQLAAAFRQRLFVTRRQALRTVLSRAVRRGELTGTADHELLIDLIHGSVYYRLLLTGQPLDGPFATRLADHILSISSPAQPVAQPGD